MRRLAATAIAAWMTFAVIAPAAAQAPFPEAARWRRLGLPAVDLGLAGPAGAAVRSVSFSGDGSQLLVETLLGGWWRSTDGGDSWRPLAVDSDLALDLARPAEATVFAVAPPASEPDAKIIADPYRSGRLYALGRDLHRSPDGGLTWINLTSDGYRSIIGRDQNTTSFHPLDPDLLLVSNSTGIWKSVDGGMTWASLNGGLPNFPAVRFSRKANSEPGDWPLLESNALGTLHIAPGLGELWRIQSDANGGEAAVGLPPGDRARMAPNPVAAPAGFAASYRVWKNGAPLSGDLTACGAQGCADPTAHYITAVANGPRGETIYAGTSDGRVWVSRDQGGAWELSAFAAGEQPVGVASIAADREIDGVAVALLASNAGPRVLRTTNSGAYWDDLSSALPPGRMRALVADFNGGAIYAGGDQGVYAWFGDIRLPAGPGSWRALQGGLPAAEVSDLWLDPVAGRLYAALAGFGVYQTRSPAVLGALRVLNAADYSERPAAPGGLVTVLGGAVSAARVGELTAPVLASSGLESQIQVPFETRGSRMELSLETARGLARIGFALSEISPAIFVDRSGPLVLDAGSGRLIDAAHPAAAGSRLLILATGLGRVEPQWPTGVPAPLDNPPAAVATVAAYLNGTPIEVVAAALAPGYIGAYLVEAKVPSVLNAGTAELRISAGGRDSNSVTIFTDPLR